MPKGYFFKWHEAWELVSAFKPGFFPDGFRVVSLVFQVLRKRSKTRSMFYAVPGGFFNEISCSLVHVGLHRALMPC